MRRWEKLSQCSIDGSSNMKKKIGGTSTDVSWNASIQICVSIWIEFVLTGYKIKDDRKFFLGTFIMSFNALVTHIFKNYYM